LPRRPAVAMADSVAPAPVATEQQAPCRPECGQMGGLGILGSVADLPKTKALGIELRSTAALAAPVCMLDGSFEEELVRFYHDRDLLGGPEQALATLTATLNKVMDHFSWRGVVGCSITVEVSKRLGVESDDFAVLEKDVGKLLADSLELKGSFMHTVVHTDAAGYNDLVWGSDASESLWRGQSIVVCTLGKFLGAVMFNDGHRVRNSPMKSVAAGPFCSAPGCKWMPPDVKEPGFQTWAKTIDTSLGKIIEAVPQVSRLILLPTGRTAREQEHAEQLMPLLTQATEAAEKKGCEVTIRDQPEGAVVSGVALCAVVELETTQVLRSMETVLNGDHALHLLSDAQLHVIFDKMDASGTGFVEVSNLRGALQLLGIQREVSDLAEELDDAHTGQASFDSFLRWWRREVRRARVVRVTSADAWKAMLQTTPPEGYGDLIILEITFTFCRSCRKFDKTFQKMAETYSNVRFCQFVANATIGGMDFCTKELGVKTSPAFFVFRRGGELLGQWSGANTVRFEAKLKEVLEAEGQS